MANRLAIAAQVFGYLKRTVSNLSEPFKPLSALKIEAEGVSNADRPSQLENVEISQREEKRKCGSPIRVTKRRKIANGSIDLSVVGSGHAMGFTLQGPSENGHLFLNQSNCNIESSDGCLNSIFNQLLWTLKYLKYNPFRTNEEMLQMIENLCEGLGKIIVLSRLNLQDKDLIRFLRIGNTLFSLIRTYEEENSIKTTIRINNTLENVFDQFLDHFTRGDSSAEGQIKIYAFICTLVQQVKDGQMIQTLTNKLIFRIYVIATILWKACISRPNGSVQLVDQEDINSFVYYCHLVEVLMAASPSDCRLQVQENVFRSLTALEEDSGSLFVLLPNLALIVYSTVFATGIPLRSSAAAVSPLKEINR